MPPPVFVLGTMKSGTEAIYKYLTLHPNARSALHDPYASRGSVKELHFFNTPDNYNKGMRYYEHLISPMTEIGTFLIDATPGYVLCLIADAGISASLAQ